MSKFTLTATTSSTVIMSLLMINIFLSLAAIAVIHGYYGPGTGPIVMARLGCQGNEYNLNNCSHTVNTQLCTHGRDAGVKCFAQLVTGGNCTLGDVRIATSNSKEGRIEVCFNGVWGTVCDEDWDNIDAGVACSQLGYSNS